MLETNETFENRDVLIIRIYIQYKHVYLKTAPYSIGYILYFFQHNSFKIQYVVNQ